MKLSDPVLIALITTVPTIGVTITGFLVALRGYRRDRAEEMRIRCLDHQQRDEKMNAIHDRVNGNNLELLNAVTEANRRLVAAGLPVVEVQHVAT